jgi:lipopolysaccharide transport system permease protein
MTLVLRRRRHAADLVRELVARDVKLRYRRSVLGIAWSQLAPLATLAILTFVFGHVLPLKIDHYPAFLVIGLLPWIWFQSATVSATQSVVAGRDLVRQPGFTVPLLPVVAISSSLINYVLALPVMFLFIGLSYRHIAPTAALLPLVIAVQFLLMLGPAFVLSAVNVRYRDVGHIVEIALLPLFYATPVFYVQPPRQFQLVYTLNPLAHLMAAYRAILAEGRLPNFSALGIIALIGIALIAAGYKIFDRLSFRFPEEL